MNKVEGGINYRKIFETQFHDLPRDVRAAAAGTAEGSALSALCFDPDPMVIKAILENMQTNLDHARLIANHHRHSTGLAALAERAQFARDAQVRRHLMRNPQTTEPVLIKVLNPLPLQQLYPLNISRENSERAKRVLRQVFRKKFQQSSAEERVGLIFSTEGRCLNLLIGLTFDSKMSALMCRRSYHASLIIQNLARFPATPPAVIGHLLKQQVVRRSPALRKILLRHSNCPTELKRKG